VSFAIPAGSRSAIVGSSGSGKSTIVNLLLRFWDYHEGQITIGGRELHDYRADEVRALLGVVPQNVHLFNATITTTCCWRTRTPLPSRSKTRAGKHSCTTSLQACR